MDGIAAQQHVTKSADKGQRDSGQSYVERCPPDAQQVFRLCFQPDCKKQKDGANLGDGINGFIWHHQARAIRAYQHAGQDLTQNCGKMEPLEYLSKDLGPNKDEEELKEK